MGPRLEKVGSWRSVRGFHDVLIGSREFLMLRWTTLEKVL
jgi:hypothetical protein